MGCGSLKAKGLELSHTKVVFLQPNTTSKIQPLDAGIIANVKAMFRKRLIEHQLAQLSQGIGVQVDIRMAVMWAAEAWADVTTTTIVNCWRKVGILPGECVLCPASNQAMEELRHLLLDFSSATHESLCDIPDCEQIPGEDIVQESLDDDICAAGGAGTAGEPCQSIDDDPEMVEEAPQILSLRDARVAAQGVLYFLMDNQNHVLVTRFLRRLVRFPSTSSEWRYHLVMSNDLLQIFSDDSINLCHFCARR